MKLAWKPVLKIWIKIILLGYAICGQPIGMTAIMMFIRNRIGMMARENCHPDSDSYDYPDSDWHDSHGKLEQHDGQPDTAWRNCEWSCRSCCWRMAAWGKARWVDRRLMKASWIDGGIGLDGLRRQMIWR